MKVTSGLRAWVRFITMLGYYDNGRNAHNHVCNMELHDP